MVTYFRDVDDNSFYSENTEDVFKEDERENLQLGRIGSSRNTMKRSVHDHLQGSLSFNASHR